MLKLLDAEKYRGEDKRLRQGNSRWEGKPHYSRVYRIQGHYPHLFPVAQQL